MNTSLRVKLRERSGGGPGFVSATIRVEREESLTPENGAFPGIRVLIPRFLPKECGGSYSEHQSDPHTALTHLSVSRYVPLRNRINFSPKERALPFLIWPEFEIGRKGAHLL